MPYFILVLLILQNTFPFSRSLMLNLPLGAKCEGNWICSRSRDCTSIFPLSLSRPNICSFINNNEPVYCCPPHLREVSYHKIYSQCKETANSYCSMIRTKRQSDYFDSYDYIEPSVPVMGGYTANPRSHTHMALVGYGNVLDDVIWACAGTIINPKFILSAAHCAVDTYRGKASWVKVGDLDISTDQDDAIPQFARISQRIIHPIYKDGLAYHDIALFKLDSDLQYSKYVGPICLDTAIHIEVPEAIISGWGQTGYVNRRSSHLMVVDLPIVAGETCKRLLGRSQMLPYGVDTETMVCAGEEDGGKDACQGDSGGPLALNASILCLKTQIGVISFGRMCGLPNTPGVYTRIYYYLPWIVSIVWPEFNED